jgi:broad specificity phosphatase PhoE
MELSPLGLEQVQALADYFQRHPPHVMYASPMKRVQQTLAPLSNWTGLEPVIIPQLREIDFGEWTGLSWEQVNERYKVSAFQWLSEIEQGRIAGAEPVAEFRERIAQALQIIVNNSEHKEIAVICHGGVIRMILALLLELPFAQMNVFDIEYASITRVALSGAKREVELMNFAPWRDL